MSSREPKSLILDAALAAFAEMGFEQATTAHIRERAGVSNGALFHHFPSKDAIAEALYLRGIAAYQEGLLQRLEPHRGTLAGRATIRAAVHHHLAWVETNRDLAWFMYERGRPDWHPSHGTAVRKLNRATAVHIRDWIAPLAAASVIRDLPFTVLVACIVGPAHFVAGRWLSGLIAAPLTSFTDTLADAAWLALAQRKPRRVPAPNARTSAASIIEAAALDAACSAAPATSKEDWRVVQLTMTSTLEMAAPSLGSALAQSIRLEGDGCIAMADIELHDGEGNVVTRGHAVCLRRKPSAEGAKYVE
jgi:AcrR family transcriptional regulator